MDWLREKFILLLSEIADALRSPLTFEEEESSWTEDDKKAYLKSYISPLQQAITNNNLTSLKKFRKKWSGGFGLLRQMDFSGLGLRIPERVLVSEFSLADRCLDVYLFPEKLKNLIDTLRQPTSNFERKNSWDDEKKQKYLKIMFDIYEGLKRGTLIFEDNELPKSGETKVIVDSENKLPIHFRILDLRRQLSDDQVKESELAQNIIFMAENIQECVGVMHRLQVWDQS